MVGVKPSYGRVSRYGLVAFASSLDQVGPFARDARSAARLLEVIAGVDGHDSTCADVPVGAYEAACERPVKGLRIGIPEEYFGEGLDPAVAASVKAAISALESEGCSVHPVALPHTKHGIATYYIVATAEASSNLARFDGVRFGLRVEPPRGDLQALYGKTRNAGFGPEVKRRILLGTYVLSSGYYDAYYRQAQKARTLIKRDSIVHSRRSMPSPRPRAPAPPSNSGKKPMTRWPCTWRTSTPCRPVWQASLGSACRVAWPRPRPRNLRCRSACSCSRLRSRKSGYSRSPPPSSGSPRPAVPHVHPVADRARLVSSAAELQLEVAAARAVHTDALLSLFERTSTPCHCQFGTLLATRMLGSIGCSTRPSKPRSVRREPGHGTLRAARRRRAGCGASGRLAEVVSGRARTPNSTTSACTEVCLPSRVHVRACLPSAACWSTKHFGGAVWRGRS